MLFKHVDTWLSLAFLALSAIIYSTAAGYDPMPSRFPIILAATLALLSGLLFFNTLMSVRGKVRPAWISLQGWRMPGLVTVGMVAYAAALDFAGFIVPSIIFVFYIGWALGYRRFGVLLFVALLSVVVVYGVFGVLLGVPLPRPPFMD